MFSAFSSSYNLGKYVHANKYPLPIIWYKLKSASDLVTGKLLNYANSTLDATTTSTLSTTQVKNGTYSLWNNGTTLTTLPSLPAVTSISICYWVNITSNLYLLS